MYTQDATGKALRGSAAVFCSCNWRRCVPSCHHGGASAVIQHNGRAHEVHPGWKLLPVLSPDRVLALYAQLTYALLLLRGMNIFPPSAARNLRRSTAIASFARIISPSVPAPEDHYGACSSNQRTTHALALLSVKLPAPCHSACCQNVFSTPCIEAQAALIRPSNTTCAVSASPSFQSADQDGGALCTVPKNA